jgi:hypothetical protein
MRYLPRVLPTPGPESFVTIQLSKTTRGFIDRHFFYVGLRRVYLEPLVAMTDDLHWRARPESNWLDVGFGDRPATSASDPWGE